MRGGIYLFPDTKPLTQGPLLPSKINLYKCMNTKSHSLFHVESNYTPMSYWLNRPLKLNIAEWWHRFISNLVHANRPWSVKFMKYGQYWISSFLTWIQLWSDNILSTKIDLLVLRPNYSGRRKSILWLLVSPSHQQQWYWLCRISVSSIWKIYLRSLIVRPWDLTNRCSSGYWRILISPATCIMRRTIHTAMNNAHITRGPSQ